jgi:hypothetical protein
MLAATAIRTIQASPSTLILQEPGYTAGYVLVAAGLVWLLVALFLFGSPRPRLLAAALLFVPPILLTLAGLLAATWETRAIFDRKANEIIVETVMFSIPTSRSVTPLSRVQYAEVVTIDVSRNIVLHLDNGSVIHLVSNSDRPGHYEAAHAINEFLHRLPATPVVTR